tara:strand:+ start:148 stop:453 length:306 start_codon:yes stop_codon:yes gene_type:complete
MIIFIDIDETICETPGEKNVARDYSLATPIERNIMKANKMYDAGHHITYWTARGTQTGIDWTDVTKVQLNKWGAKYHEVILGKPHYDLFICDKAMNTEEWK